MLESLGKVPYPECHGAYGKVRALVEEATPEMATRSMIFAILFRHGGRCDCTVDRNIVSVPLVLAEVEAGIAAALASSS